MMLKRVAVVYLLLCHGKLAQAGIASAMRSGLPLPGMQMLLHGSQSKRAHLTPAEYLRAGAQHGRAHGGGGGGSSQKGYTHTHSEFCGCAEMGAAQPEHADGQEYGHVHSQWCGCEGLKQDARRDCAPAQKRLGDERRHAGEVNSHQAAGAEEFEVHEESTCEWCQISPIVGTECILPPRVDEVALAPMLACTRSRERPLRMLTS